MRLRVVAGRVDFVDRSQVLVSAGERGAEQLASGPRNQSAERADAVDSIELEQVNVVERAGEREAEDRAVSIAPERRRAVNEPVGVLVQSADGERAVARTEGMDDGERPSDRKSVESSRAVGASIGRRADESPVGEQERLGLRECGAGEGEIREHGERRIRVETEESPDPSAPSDAAAP